MWRLRRLSRKSLQDRALARALDLFPRGHLDPARAQGPTPSQAPQPKTRYYGSIDLDPKKYAQQMSVIVTEVIAKLAAQEGTQFSVSLDIEATNADGFTEQTIRTVGENSATLKFDQHGFEEG